MKTSRWGKSVYLCVVLCFLCFLVAGCAPKEKPEDNVMSLSKGILYQDAETLSKFKVDSDKMHKEMINAFNRNFNAGSAGIFSKDQSTRVGESCLNMLKRAEISTKAKSQDGEKAEVEITVSKFDMEKAFNEQTLVEKLKSRLPANASEKMVIETITDIMVETMDGLQPDGTQTITVQCTYDKNNKMWMPDDVEKFTDQLLSTVLDI
ncbi:hypothetical protein SELR_27300 [Selenomonas ruminantium subsp. lactilytica TAM6421]|uniref:DUF5105 domain-containing protein n=1 Tax=Selenomonas ruminantium subsp. lactilytica (strain NBRC 103574 / TAM6421) TaxID=927704 RepID=I0GUK1_SELRL|nr:hypothetical protein [Selenomonas ruminantium]BAL84438.1 hypothetical protein SELR_27300 [Selenomonas ruminantium subsp. lactilytica TAM6421]